VCPSRFDAVMRISGAPVPPPIPEEKRMVIRKSKRQ
jgi:NADH-quinone oxidoreductase subunit F